MDVAEIGTAAQGRGDRHLGARGGYFARRTREIYYTAAAAARRAARVMAVNVDTKTDARGAQSRADSSMPTRACRSSRTPTPSIPTGSIPSRPSARSCRNCSACFPARDGRSDARSAVFGDEGRRTGARARSIPALQSFIFTNLKTGESRETGFQYGDLNHMQFNPVDPNLLLYCHEGTWHELDRTWTIRADGSQMRLMHARTMDMEINGHEWWSFDGKTVWFDLQTPRSQVFWIAGVNVATGKRGPLSRDRDWWGVHFNSSRDNTIFAGDGGDPSQVAYSTDGMWINLFRVQPNGTVSREKLVDMSKHNYVTGRGGVEPNVHITPDKKWVVFTGQFAQGQRHVYAVQIAK